MSLYVGHLSPHVQPDELERVFRRFGRCSFQLKDGYGFVVYEVTANAERALRALRGKYVCGEQISLNWSNKQPRPFQRPTRGSRFDEQPYRRKIFREEENATGFRNSQDRRDFPPDVSFPAYNRGRRRIDGAPHKEAGHTDEEADGIRGKRDENLTNMLMNDEDAGELNSLEHDRWGEPPSDSLPGHGVGKGSDFDDRYEPYHGYGKRGEKEGNQRGSSDSSPYRDFSGKGKHFNLDADRKFDKSIPHLTCYNCGQAGHIKRKCPEGEVRRDRFIQFEQMRDEMSFRDKVEGRLKRFKANSWGRPSCSRDPFVSRRDTWEGKELNSNNVENSVRTKTSPERKEKHRSKLRSKSQTKKGTKKKYLSKKRSEKKRRISDSSSTSSDSSKSSSGKSKSSSISDTRSRSTSRSASSKSGSSSSRSRSISISSYAKSKSSRSRSRSMSRPVSRSTPDRSLSLSISLGPKSSSSPKNKEIQNSEHMESPESKAFSKMNNSGIRTLEDGNALSPLGVKSHSNLEYSGKNSVCAAKSDLEVGYNQTDACFDVLNGAASASEKNPETSTRQDALLMKPVEQLPDSRRKSTAEMLSALHHYGLVSPKEDGENVTVESYLGAARLWPWEMIYYRRLKRGPISTENYAKRLEQNKEFGIVDKYIRSSSGWGERERDL